MEIEVRFRGIRHNGAMDDCLHVPFLSGSRRKRLIPPTDPCGRHAGYVQVGRAPAPVAGRLELRAALGRVLVGEHLAKIGL